MVMAFLSAVVHVLLGFVTRGAGLRVRAHRPGGRDLQDSVWHAGGMQ
jgi:hypothetical protein